MDESLVAERESQLVAPMVAYLVVYLAATKVASLVD